MAAAGCRSLGAPADGAALDARARLIRMEDTRRADHAVLDTALRSDDARVRRAAALAAGRLGARRHVVALRALAADTDGNVAGAALYALGLLRDTASAQLAQRTLRSSSAVAREGAWLLGEIGDAGRTALLAAALDSALPSSARGAALLALARLRPPPGAPLLPLLSHREPAIAWRAAYVVARSRSPAAVRAMIAATGSSDVDVRDYAVRGLARSLTGDSLEAPSLDALRRLVRDPSPRVRVSAVRVLGAYGIVAGPALAIALRDPDAGVRVTAASFAHLALDSSATAWAEAWRRDTTLAVRVPLAQSGARRGMLAAAWAPWRSDIAWQHRAAAAALEGTRPARDAPERLEPYLRDRDGRVRASAVDALAGLLDSAAVGPTIRTRLRAALRDPDFVVRANALGALARQAAPDDLGAALSAFDVARGDADLDARLAFWALADSVLRRGAPLPDSVARMLAALSRPADPIERARAAGIPRFGAWRDSTSPPRADAWYRERAREALSGAGIVALVETDRGNMELDLHSADAPVTVHNFVTLARRGYFDAQRFHRVVPNFVIQAGDPRGDGNGGPGYAIRDELNPHRYERGTLGMALSGPNTGGSQWFVTHAPQPHLDGGYTVFGQLRRGSDVLDRIVQGDRIVRITIR